MNVTISIPVLVGVVAAAVAIYFLVRSATRFTRTVKGFSEEVAKLTAEVAGARDEANDLRSLLVQATSALDKTSTMLAATGEELQTNLVAIPKILEGILKVCDMQFETYKKLSVATRGTGPRPTAQVQDAESASMEYAIQQRMREGVSRGQAELEMNPANVSSPWDSFNMGGQL